MKIVIKNFAPISFFEFDTSKDMTLIFGKNNIGKSYAITAIYLIIKNLNFEKGVLSDVLRLYDDELVKSKEVDSVQKKEEALQKLFNYAFIPNLEKSLISSFASLETLSNRFSKQPLSIELFFNFDEIDFTIYISKPQEHLQIERLKINTVSYSNMNVQKLVLRKLRFLIKNIYFLPSSRSGLYQALNAFSAIIVELAKSRNFLTKSIELPTISEPVSDYFLNLSTLSNQVNTNFSPIVAMIENEILKGQVKFNSETKKLFFSPSELNLELDLAFTSSMISEIAPIVAHLKYIINSKEEGANLIFIEEPEAHLHPEIQVKLLEVFCKLLNQNVKIIMTSHSNYMFNKLSNLILDNQVNHEKIASYLMKPSENGSILDTVAMKAEEDGMNDENFADIAEMLYQERINIFDKLNHQHS